MRTALVERARDGDEDAFTQLVDLDGNRCFAIAYRILRDVERAKDAVQQAFLLAWRELPRLRDPERFQVWLYRLLVIPARTGEPHAPLPGGRSRRIGDTHPRDRDRRSGRALRARGRGGDAHRGLHRVPHAVTATGSTGGRPG